MLKDFKELSIMIISGTREEVLEEYAKARQRNKICFCSMQVTTINDVGAIRHFYHLLLQYEPKNLQ